ncbi:MAG TPA: septum formation initiator family protein [Acidimicrobiales bacterium]
MATARVLRLPLVNPREAGGERSRHLWVVRPHRGRLRLSPRAGVVLTVLAFVALFLVAVCHALLIESQATLDELDADVAAEQARYEELRQDVAALQSPERIKTDAVERLGMVEAGEVVWLTPDEPAPPGHDGPDEVIESPDTSAARVKPHIEATP